MTVSVFVAHYQLAHNCQACILLVQDVCSKKKWLHTTASPCTIYCEIFKHRWHNLDKKKLALVVSLVFEDFTINCTKNGHGVQPFLLGLHALWRRARVGTHVWGLLGWSYSPEVAGLLISPVHFQELEKCAQNEIIHKAASYRDLKKQDLTSLIKLYSTLWFLIKYLVLL